MKQKLRVCWIPLELVDSFKVEADTTKEGVKLMDILADYDNLQYDNNIKSDYSNVGGIEQYSKDSGEGESWDVEDENLEELKEET